MAAIKFPRTWRQVLTCPFIDFTENYPGEDGVFLHVRMDWLPPGFEISNACSARGETLHEALAELRSDLWNWIRDPATGKPVSNTPADWPQLT